MIHGLKEMPLVSLINSDYVFYLTGSRFFGTERPNSDWDFFAEDSRGLMEFLKSLGFEEEPYTLYQDRSIVTVMVKELDPETDQNVKIHVQLLHAKIVKAKRAVQKIIKENIVLLKALHNFKGSKSKQSQFWTALIDLYNFNRN